MCARQVGRADVELAAAWQAALERLPPEKIETLRAEQRSWLRQRDAACPVGADPATDQTAAACLFTWTRERTDVLAGIGAAPAESGHVAERAEPSVTADVLPGRPSGETMSLAAATGIVGVFAADGTAFAQRRIEQLLSGEARISWGRVRVRATDAKLATVMAFAGRADWPSDATIEPVVVDLQGWIDAPLELLQRGSNTARKPACDVVIAARGEVEAWLGDQAPALASDERPKELFAIDPSSWGVALAAEASFRVEQEQRAGEIANWVRQGTGNGLGLFRLAQRVENAATPATICHRLEFGGARHRLLVAGGLSEAQIGTYRWVERDNLEEVFQDLQRNRCVGFLGEVGDASALMRALEGLGSAVHIEAFWLQMAEFEQLLEEQAMVSETTSQPAARSAARGDSAATDSGRLPPAQTASLTPSSVQSPASAAGADFLETLVSDVSYEFAPDSCQSNDLMFCVDEAEYRQLCEAATEHTMMAKYLAAAAHGSDLAASLFNDSDVIESELSSDLLEGRRYCYFEVVLRPRSGSARRFTSRGPVTAFVFDSGSVAVHMFLPLEKSFAAFR